MAGHDQQDADAQLVQLKQGIREITHDISNPLGVLRMAAYYLQHGNPDKDRQDHYYSVIAETVERVEVSLNKLRSLTEPAVSQGKDPAAGKGTYSHHLSLEHTDHVLPRRPPCRGLQV